MNALQIVYSAAMTALIEADKLLDAAYDAQSIDTEEDMDAAEIRHNAVAVEIGYDGIWDTLQSAERALLEWGKSIALGVAQTKEERDGVEIAYGSKRIQVRRQIISLIMKLEV